MRSRERGTLLLAGPGDQGDPDGMGTWSPGTQETKAPAPSRSTRNIGSKVHEVARPAEGPWFQCLRGNRSTRVNGKLGIQLPMGLDTIVAMATWIVGTMVPPEPGGRRRAGHGVGPRSSPAADSGRGRGVSIGAAASRTDPRQRGVTGRRAGRRHGGTAGLRDAALKKKHKGD